MSSHFCLADSTSGGGGYFGGGGASGSNAGSASGGAGGSSVTIASSGRITVRSDTTATTGGDGSVVIVRCLRSGARADHARRRTTRSDRRRSRSVAFARSVTPRRSSALPVVSRPLLPLKVGRSRGARAVIDRFFPFSLIGAIVERNSLWLALHGACALCTSRRALTQVSSTRRPATLAESQSNCNVACVTRVVCSPRWRSRRSSLCAR